MEVYDVKVIVASPRLRLNGVNVFSVNLVEKLRRREIRAHILRTRPESKSDPPLDVPSTVPVRSLPLGESPDWRQRWRSTKSYLEERRPCIYIPNHGYEASIASPKLSRDVAIAGIVHSDDPEHYDHVERLGSYWNAVVAVSRTIATNVRRRFPYLTDRLKYIPYGVSVPEAPLQHSRTRDHKQLRIVYAGRLIQRQKRILDLANIAVKLFKQEVPFELTVIGSGPDEREFREVCGSLIDQGHIRMKGVLTNREVLREFGQADVFVMTSDFEGLPISLLEAMVRGCVPVVTDIESGIPELIDDGVNGYCVPPGSIDKFVQRLAWIQEHPDVIHQMSRRAHDTIVQKNYTLEDMVERYCQLFEQLVEDLEGNVFHRPDGPVVPPPRFDRTWKDYLPDPIRQTGSSVKRWFRKTWSPYE